MTQSQLDRVVAQATGESVALVRSLGFSHHQVPTGSYARRVADRLRRFRNRARCKVTGKSRPTNGMADVV